MARTAQLAMEVGGGRGQRAVPVAPLRAPPHFASTVRRLLLPASSDGRRSRIRSRPPSRLISGLHPARARASISTPSTWPPTPAAPRSPPRRTRRARGRRAFPVLCDGLRMRRAGLSYTQIAEKMGKPEQHVIDSAPRSRLDVERADRGRTQSVRARRRRPRRSSSASVRSPGRAQR
jgi:hypothetical protein